MSLVREQLSAAFLSRSRSVRLVPTAATAAVMFGLFLAYASVVRPMIATPDSVVARVWNLAPSPKGLPENSELARRYLSKQPWAADADHQIMSERTVVFFDEFELVESGWSAEGDHPTEPGRSAVRLTPLAMIVLPKEKPGQTPTEPITIHCKSALVQFEKPFSIRDPDPGRVVNGALEGTVIIEGPDNLRLEGRKFDFTENTMQLECDTEVLFTYQQHHGSAQGMKVTLVPDQEARDRGNLSIVGVKLLQLLQDVELNLVSEPDSKESGSSDPRDVQITSQGRFRFEVDTSVATFRKNVDVQSTHRARPQEVDRLACDLLTLVFEKQSPNASDPTTRPAKDNSGPDRTPLGMSSELTFQRLSADGEQVTLTSDANQLEARMTRLVYDGQSKVAELTDPNDVQVFRESSEIHSPLIRLVQDGNGNLTHVTCRGSGWLKHVNPEHGGIDLAARWFQEMRMRPDSADPRFDIIELERQALVQQPQEGTQLAAEFIRMWVDRQATPQPTRRESSDGRVGQPMDNLRPDRLLAQENVGMSTPDMDLETDRLEVWFERPPKAQGRVNPKPAPNLNSSRAPASSNGGIVLRESAAVRSGDVRRLQATSGIRRFYPVEPARKNSQPTRGADSAIHLQGIVAPKQPASLLGTRSEKQAKPEEPIKVVADLVRVQVILGDEQRQSQVSQVWTLGNVDVSQQGADGAAGMHVTGHVLQMTQRSETQRLLEVYGKPAHVRNQDLHIEADNIHVDRSTNLAWVDGPGRLDGPVTQDLDGNQLEEPQKLSVWWKESMRFDGLQARFLGNARTVLDGHNMLCQDMRVDLTERIRFDDNSGQQRPEVARVVCANDVQFDSQEKTGEQVTSIRNGRCAEFTIDRSTGDTAAQGPGQIHSWSFGRGLSAGLEQSNSGRANRAAQIRENGWEYTRVVFAGTMDGNVNRQSTTFHGRVRITYGPVERPQKTIDPDHLPADGGWMRCKSLNVTQVKTDDEQKEHVELLARGNVELDGKSTNGNAPQPLTYSASADEVSYDSSKGAYQLRSFGKRKSVLYRQIQLGAANSKADSQRIGFVPSRNEIRLDNTSGIDGIE